MAIVLLVRELNVSIISPARVFFWYYNSLCGAILCLELEMVDYINNDKKEANLEAKANGKSKEYSLSSLNLRVT